MGWSKKKSRSIFAAVTRSFWNILFWGMLFGVIAMVYNVFMTPTVYRSEASVYIGDAASETPAELSGSAAGGSAVISSNDSLSYAEVMTNDKTLRRVKKTLDSSMTTEQLSDLISVEQVGSTAVFTITVDYKDAQSARMIAKAEAKSAVKSLKSVGVTASVLDSGTLPTMPVSPHVFRNTLIAVVAGAILRWLFAIIAAASDHTLQGREEWESAFDIPVLAEIPERDDR